MDKLLSALSFGTNSLILAKLILGGLVLVAVFAAETMIITEVEEALAGIGTLEFMGYDLPIVDLLAYVGFFQALGIVFGAWGAVLLIRTVYRVIGWL